ncbi:hypothetical protein A1O3_00869 [Capronia epimyces CBS 606.96]|uniref:Protein NO VEIN C-terminal domain-containing protein n=1 Tax=Capronia epimyces CBS 606.96 TaxID=1182542 RepID=W9ZCR6_9EURO|nr:uncharacterized protein A1O3_00869 [Capronia epimyces CBS 606.96]EXJ92319.1 hypothetical protein A1O3_00869 [Capronia epimyces CBS 606.96]
MSDGVVEHPPEPTTYEEACQHLKGLRERFEVPQQVQEDLLQAKNHDGLRWTRDFSERLINSESKELKGAIQEVYQNSSRVLYELIQNADDAQYEAALERGQAPVLTFTLGTEELVIDTNEDGFTRANVDAMCAIRESSKTNAASKETTGEKGIGFKSVFLISSLVHVQSGVWSFSFEYDQANALSMITPVETPIETPISALPENIGTRIRLTYNPSYRNDIIGYLQELPHETIIFLRKLQKISISIQVDGTRTPWSSETSRSVIRAASDEAQAVERNASTVNDTSRPPASSAELPVGVVYSDDVTAICLTVKCSENEKNSSFQKYYYQLFSHSFQDMPPTQSRPGIDEDTRVGVELAFPCGKDGQEPLICEKGEHFLIQSDFLTMQNRQDIVDCPWNQKLRSEAVDAFILSATHLRTKKELRFSWPLFLPLDQLHDDFWEGFRTLLLAKLKEEPILEARDDDHDLYQPGHLAILPDWFLYGDQKKPLFRDLQQKIYLSQDYTKQRAIEHLNLLGVYDISSEAIVQRIERDLKRKKPFMKSKHLQKDWHDAMSGLMERILGASDGATNINDRLRALDIIYLRNGSWANMKQEVFFPTINGHAIPDGLGLKLLHHDVCDSPKRRQIYKKTMGVRECEPDLVIQKIKDFLSPKAPERELTEDICKTYVSQFHFLFHFRSRLNYANLSSLCAITSKGTVRPCSDGLYFRSKGKYDTQNILTTILGVEDVASKEGEIDSDIILHQEFDVYGNDEDTKQKWTEWLTDAFSIRYYPPFIEGVDGVSNLLAHLYLTDTSLFLGALQTHWSKSYQEEYDRMPESEGLLDLVYSCLDGSQQCLRGAYFPEDELLQMSRDFDVASSMPILCLPEGYQQEEWSVLTTLGIRRLDRKVDFCLDALLALQKLGVDEYECSEDSGGSSEDLDWGSKDPDWGGDDPSGSSDDPDGSTDDPDGSTYDPDRSSDDPDGSTDDHDRSSDDPDGSTDDPDGSSDDPDGSTDDPDGSSDGPDEYNEALNPLNYNVVRKVYETISQEASYKSSDKLKKFFSEYPCICNPVDTSDWRLSADCVWDGPEFLTCKLPLKCHHEDSNDMKNFFATLLGLNNATYQDICQELQNIRWTNTSTSTDEIAQLVSQVYTELSKAGSEEEKSRLRGLCEDEELIFANGSWWAPSKCIWESGYPLPQRASLEDHYPELKSFFVNILKVPEVNARVLLEGLLDIAKAETPQIDKTKEILLALGPMLETDSGSSSSIDELLEPLGQKKFLPVRFKDRVSLQETTSNFFIIDHERFGRAFEGKVELLDFTLEEFRLLEGFFRMCRLEKHYLSACVVESSEVPTEAIEDSARTLDFRRRAYVFSCCAAAFSSKKYFNRNDSMHRLLLEATVYTSTELQTVLSLATGENKRVSTASERAKPSIRNDEQGIRIYLPTKAADLQRSFKIDLPDLIMELLGIEFRSAQHCLYFLLTERLENLHEILEQQDIPMLTWLERIDLTPSTPAGDSDVDALANDLQELDLSSLHRAAERPMTVTVPVRVTDLADDRSKYDRLLEHIVQQVREGSQTGAEQFQRFNTVETFGTPKTNPDYFHWIGAAGELFVYEKLLSLDLPGFRTADHQNWKSNIRRFVRGIDEYSDMSAYNGPDMDIVYTDKTGDFTTWLQTEGYDALTFLPDMVLPVTPDSPIKYLIEVKTTPGPLETAMFVSNAQYNKMRRMRIPPEGWNDSDQRQVFLLWRVWNLLDQNPRDVIFADPLRLGGDVLEFVAERWKVTACHT